MIKRRITIPFRLPGMNEYVNACRTNPHVGAKLKRDTERDIVLCLNGERPAQTPCIIAMVFTEANRRMDCDNVESARKYILDAMQTVGIIPNDSPKYVMAAPSFTVYADHPKVEVVICQGTETELRDALKSAREIWQ